MRGEGVRHMQYYVKVVIYIQAQDCPDYRHNCILNRNGERCQSQSYIMRPIEASFQFKFNPLVFDSIHSIPSNNTSPLSLKQSSRNSSNR